MSVLEAGGLSVHATDPAALSAWYRDHLGVGAPLGEFLRLRWRLNRVGDLDGLIGSGVEVATKPEWNEPRTSTIQKARRRARETPT